MKATLRKLTLTAFLLLFLPAMLTVQQVDVDPDDSLSPPVITFHIPPPQFFEREVRERTNAPLVVALVFGRSPGCTNADPELINTVAKEAVRAGLPPKVLAATVAVESQCNQFAVSSRGALGLTQVMPRIWKDRFDFEKVNLLNPHDNIRTGAVIMAGLVKEHGLSRGVQLYNGAGVGCPTCDGGYSEKVLTLAGGHQ